MHTSVLALRACWGTYLASKGSGTRNLLVHFVMKKASDADERAGHLVVTHFAMKEARYGRTGWAARGGCGRVEFTRLCIAQREFP